MVGGAMVDVFPVTWSAGDTGPGDTCRVTVFGKTPDGEAACVHVRFTPYFFVEMPRGTSEAQCRLHMARWAQRFDTIPEKCRAVSRASLWGFRGGAKGLFAQVVFPSMEAFRKARYGIAKEFDTYEAAVDPVMRLFHLRGVGPCRWMAVANAREPDRMVADVDVELECNFTDVSPSDRTTRPPLVFASESMPRNSRRCGSPQLLLPALTPRPGDFPVQVSTSRPGRTRAASRWGPTPPTTSFKFRRPFSATATRSRF